MRTRSILRVGAAIALVAGFLFVNDAQSQPRKGGKDAGSRKAGHSAGARPAANPSPAMSRPAPKASPMPAPKSGARPKGAGGPPEIGKKSPESRPAGGFQRPGTPAGKAEPKTGVKDRPRPGGGSSGAMNDFLGKDDDRPGPGSGRLPKTDPKVDRDRLPKDDPKIDRDKLPKVAGKDDPRIDRDRPKSPKIRVGDVNVNVDNSIDYSKDQKAWVDNRHATGNNVRVNSGNRYAAAYGSTNFRRAQPGAYPYSAGWASRGAYHGWQPATYAGFGAFMGAAWTSPKPVYNAYGTGGNVYYEDNSVYVNGESAGTVEQYAQQLGTLLAAAPPPDKVEAGDWLPLGAFALTREGVDDSQGMIELAVNKQGVVAGTYFNEATGVSRPVKGMADAKTQRVALGFADGKNADAILETVVYNLTQAEAPAMMHFGAMQATPVLLVRLDPPAGK